jgi:uncharacterized protein involved in response to NO
MKWAFWLLTLGTLARLLSHAGSGFTVASVLLWVSAYGVFMLRYMPILLSPRLSTQ